MNRSSKWIRVALTAMLALVCAGSAATTLATATGAAITATRIWLAAAASALLCALASFGGAASVASLALAAGTIAVYVAHNRAGVQAIRPFAAYWMGSEVAASDLLLGGNALLTALAFALGGAFYGLLYKRELTSLALLLLGALLVGSHGMSETASIPASLPGLAAGAAAFALTGRIPRDRAMLRAALPSVLAVALAFMLLPSGRITWRPLENAAERVRSVFEQYFNFTKQRIAFSINEQGYDHAGETEDGVVAMLGGPATPHDDAVMTVEADAELLLRGTIRGTYTGYSWVDLTPRSRYLLIDLTRRGLKNRVFNLDLPSDANAFETRTAKITFLREGTSTLFAPTRVAELDMPLSNAVYYNTAGEIFMARQVAAGDAYSVTSTVPVMGDALRAAAIRAEGEDDAEYAAILTEYTQLPDGIDPGVYALAREIIDSESPAWDRAAAILRYLQSNMRYTLEPDYPPQGRDFVSHFLLDTREGYCSYFASAMAVLGRMAGLPTRYVEGYLARPGASGAITLTGQDAHAWAEIYFRGLGWIPFDATAGVAGGRGASNGGGNGDGEDEKEEGGETPEPSSEVTDAPGEHALDAAGSTPSPTPGKVPPAGDAGDQPTPTPDPDDGSENPIDEPTPTPDPAPLEAPREENTPPDARSDESPRHRLWWLAILIFILLALLAVLWMRRRLRASDPEALCAKEKDDARAAMILYRANLTALSVMGQVPANGETPEAFAGRVAEQLKNPDYAAFVRAAAESRYSGRPIGADGLTAGLTAYRRFVKAFTRREKLRHTAARLRRGLGDVEQIP